MIDLYKTAGSSPPTRGTLYSKLAASAVPPRFGLNRPTPRPSIPLPAVLPMVPSPEQPPPTDQWRRSLSVADLLADPDAAAINWLWTGYVATGFVTVLAGKGKYAGKSTLLFGLTRAWQLGGDFLGQPVQRSAVVYLSEESPSTIRDKLQRFGIADDGTIRIFPRASAYPLRPFSDVIRDAVQVAQALQAQADIPAVVVVDTATFWTALSDEQENDNAAVQRLVMDPLLEATTTKGLAVVLAHHPGKGAGTDLKAFRGASAIVNSADIPCLLYRPRDAAKNERVLKADATRTAETPERITLALSGDQYIRLDQAQGTVGEPARLQPSQQQDPREPRVILPAQWSETAWNIWRAIPALDPSAAETEKAILATAGVRGHATFADWVLGQNKRRDKRGWVQMGWVVQVPGNPARYYRAYQDPPAAGAPPELAHAA